MTIDDQIRYEKLQYYSNRKAAKISAWSFGKISKYLISDWWRILPSKQ